MTPLASWLMPCAESPQLAAAAAWALYCDASVARLDRMRAKDETVENA